MNAKLCCLLLCMSSVVFAGSNWAWSSHVCPAASSLKEYASVQEDASAEEAARGVSVDGLDYGHPNYTYAGVGSGEMCRHLPEFRPVEHSFSVVEARKILQKPLESMNLSAVYLLPGNKITCLYHFKGHETSLPYMRLEVQSQKCRTSKPEGSSWEQSSTGYYPGTVEVCLLTESMTAAQCPFECKQ